MAQSSNVRPDDRRHSTVQQSFETLPGGRDYRSGPGPVVVADLEPVLPTVLPGSTTDRPGTRALSVRPDLLDDPLGHDGDPFVVIRGDVFQRAKRLLVHFVLSVPVVLAEPCSASAPVIRSTAVSLDTTRHSTRRY